jgi:hypothetical protein
VAAPLSASPIRLPVLSSAAEAVEF